MIRMGIDSFRIIHSEKSFFIFAPFIVIQVLKKGGMFN